MRIRVGAVDRPLSDETVKVSIERGFQTYVWNLTPEEAWDLAEGLLEHLRQIDEKGK